MIESLLTKWNDGSIRIKNTRLPVDYILAAYERGDSLEEILEGFPNVGSIENIENILKDFQDNKEEFDAYLNKRKREAEILENQITSAPGYAESTERLKIKLNSKKKELLSRKQI